MEGKSPVLTLSAFAQALTPEIAFEVLARARQLKAQGKEVIELQIGDSPFPTTRHAAAAGIRAITEQATHYCSSGGLPAFREVVAEAYCKEFLVPIGPENVIAAPGAKPFEQYFCEAVLDPGDAVLVFSPHFPTYPANIERRGARVVFSPLGARNQFRPDLNEVERFLKAIPRAKAILINSPHNPTGGVATAQDLGDLANLVRGRNVAVFSDEPYCHMVWTGRHHTLLAEPGMMDQVVAAYTFSKSYSMSGWRIGYAVSSPRLIDVIGKMINTTISCVAPLAQWAAQAALLHDADERDGTMRQFHRKVQLLVADLQRVEGITVEMPAATFYVFPDVSALCQRLGIQSHGLAMYLLEGADDHFGVACLGGECFGPAGQGFLRFSCAEPDDRLHQAVAFLGEAVTRTARVEQFLATNPIYRLPVSRGAAM